MFYATQPNSEEEYDAEGEEITIHIINEDVVYFFAHDELPEVYQLCVYMMEELVTQNPTLISDPEFHEIFDENIRDIMCINFAINTDEAEEELWDIIEHAKHDFYTRCMPPRSYLDTLILKNPEHSWIDGQLAILRNKPQPVQRTKEWYEFRHNLITASNAYKAFESEAMQNQLIYEKCQPLKQEIEKEEKEKEVVMVNTNTSLHWGQKYEPLTVLIYENNYATKVEDFGCIQHEQYLFLGASPDGINVDKSSPRYGRMLEIKNVVSREINGIPKKEYWIQMQLQMEVCNLDECDFLETKFTEYPDYGSYLEDTLNEWCEDENGMEFRNIGLSADNKMKGAIIYFHNTKEGSPLYLYRPLDLIHPDDILEWHENMLDAYRLHPDKKYAYVRTIFWKLEQISCVLVCRNKRWFQHNVSSLQRIWHTIETERQGNYAHRAPNSRPKKLPVTATAGALSTGCLLNFHKYKGKITVCKKEKEEKVEEEKVEEGIAMEEDKDEHEDDMVEV